MHWMIIGYLLTYFCPHTLALNAYQCFLLCILLLIIYFLTRKLDRYTWFSSKIFHQVFYFILGASWGCFYPMQYCQVTSKDNFKMISYPINFTERIAIAEIDHRRCLVEIKASNRFGYDQLYQKDQLDYLHPIKSYIFKTKKTRDHQIIYIKQLSYALETYISKRIYRLQKSIQPWFQALLLGDKSNLAQETKEAFYFLGIYHIVVISGLHFSLFNKLFLSCIKFPIKVLYCLRLINPHIFVFCNILGIFTAVFGLFIYAFTLNFTPPIQRVFILFTVEHLGSLFWGKLPIKKKITISIILQILIFPIGFIDTATLMSWAAYFFVVLPRKSKFSLWNSFSQSLSITILVSFLFGQISLIGIFANMLIIPLVPFLLSSSLTIFIDHFFASNLTTLTVIIHQSFLTLIEYTVFNISSFNFLYIDISTLRFTRIVCGILTLIYFLNIFYRKTTSHS